MAASDSLKRASKRIPDCKEGKWPGGKMMSRSSQLAEQWKALYKETLPQAARSNSSAQAEWPVSFDHCFARIILDNTLSASMRKERPWPALIRSPAYKNMTLDQLQAAIDLGRQILEGKASLVELDERSLMLRGKQSKRKRVARVHPVRDGDACRKQSLRRKV